MPFWTYPVTYTGKFADLKSGRGPDLAQQQDSVQLPPAINSFMTLVSSISSAYLQLLQVLQVENPNSA